MYLTLIEKKLLRSNRRRLVPDHRKREEDQEVQENSLRFWNAMLRRYLFTFASSANPHLFCYSATCGQLSLWRQSPISIYASLRSHHSRRYLSSSRFCTQSYSNEDTPTAAPEKKDNSTGSSATSSSNKPKKPKGKTWTLPSLKDASIERSTFSKTELEPGVIEISDPDSSTHKGSILKSTSKSNAFDLLSDNLDDKARAILQKRPELRAKMEAFMSEESEQSLRVPHGWRKNKHLPEWKRQMYALREKFGNEKWQPRKKLSREAMEGIRVLKEHSPELNAGDFAKMFKVSPESIRRILKSSWTPSEDELGKIADRWSRRGERVKSDIKVEARKERAEKLQEIQARQKEQAIVRAARGITGKKKKKKTRQHKDKQKDRDDDDDNLYGVQSMIF